MKIAPIMILIGLVVVFIIQNVAVVEIQFLFWSVSMSRSLLIFCLLAIGVAIGWFLQGHFKARKTESRTDI